MCLIFVAHDIFISFGHHYCKMSESQKIPTKYKEEIYDIIPSIKDTHFEPFSAFSRGFSYAYLIRIRIIINTGRDIEIGRYIDR